LENCVDVPRRPSVARNRSKSNAGTLFLVSIRPESSTDRIRPWAPQSIIAELEEAIQCGSQDKRVETLRRVIDLFLSGADRLNDSQIAVFDDVLRKQTISNFQKPALRERSDFGKFASDRFEQSRQIPTAAVAEENYTS
jgi:hypothetical protein